MGRERARLCPSCNSDPLDAGWRRQNDAACAKVFDDRGRNGHAAIGSARRLGRNVKCAAHVAGLEAAQTQTSHCFPGVLEPGLGAAGIVGLSQRDAVLAARIDLLAR